MQAAAENLVDSADCGLDGCSRCEDSDDLLSDAALSRIQPGLTQAEQESSLGTYLKSIRESQEFSLRDIERWSGYTMAYIIAIEKGRRRPSPFALRCIVKALNLQESQRKLVAKLYLDLEKAC